MVFVNQMYRWQNIQETVDDLTGKISLKKRDNESIFAQGKETIKRNEERIAQLRAEVKEAHQDLAKMINMDYQVIQTALNDQRSTQLECKRYDAYTALKELNEDVCVEGKQLNHFIHQKECRLRRLADLRLHYRDFCLLQESNFEKEDHRRVRLLMTKLDKMIMKRNTASFIETTYHLTLGKLNKDALAMPKHLDQLANAVQKSNAELSDLNQIYKSAKQGQEQSRAKRMYLEQEVFRSKNNRDITIVETRKRAKESSEMPDFGNIQRAPNDLIVNSNNNKTKKTHYDKPSIQLEQLTPIIKNFSIITNTVIASDIPKAYERQIENFNAMSEQAANLGKTLAERSQKAKDANAELAKVKYHQAQEIKAVEQNIVELVQNEKELSTRAEKALQESKRIQSVMGDVRDAVQALAEKLIPLKVEDAKFDTTGLSSTDMTLAQQVQVVNDKLSAMACFNLKSKIENNTAEDEEDTPDITIEQVDDVIVKLKKDILEGVRITIPTEEDASSGDNFIMDDININEHYISRDEIKRHSEKDNQKHKNIKKR